MNGVTSPGRQATNAKTLIEVLGDVTGVGVRALDAAKAARIDDVTLVTQ